MTFCSWVFAIQSSDQHNFGEQNANEILCWMLQLFNLYNYKIANEILCWMLQLTQHIQLQNENA